VTPRAGLGVNNYAATLKITGREGTEKTVALDFEVIDNPGAPKRDTVYVSSLNISGAPAGGTYVYRAAGTNSLKLGAAARPDNATNRDVEWRSGNSSVARVDGAGLVTFTGLEGSVVITAAARDGGGRSASVTIKVVRNVTKIRTPLRKVFIQKGKSLKLPVVTDDGNTGVKAKLRWKSSKPKALRVSQSGKITAAKRVAKRTSVTVTATAENGRKLKIKVTVTPKAQALKKVTAKFPGKMKAGKAYQLKIKLKKATATGVKIMFKSSKPGVVKVDKAGRLTALKKGKARITVKAGKLRYVRTVKVI
jgi:uncharacterized protein YjdB